MANREHLKILKQGVVVWNLWRVDNPAITPDLRGIDFGDQDYSGINLEAAYLEHTNLSQASFDEASFKNARLENVFAMLTDLRHTNFAGADLSSASLNDARLGHVNFAAAILGNAVFEGADLSSASFRLASLASANFTGAKLHYADFAGAKLWATVFGDNDLRLVKGLNKVVHIGPSTLGIDTLYKSAGQIPESFLRGCGVPDDFITFIPSHFGIQQAIQFYSCFISYSTKDEEFARRLYSRMRDEKLRVWFAPEDIKGGQKLHEQIERAIQLHDRLLLVLSENSMRSEWVMTEIRRARKTEVEENRRKLFPITLVEFDKVKAWKCFDADSGKDLAIEIREYFIPDFSNWKEHDAFEAAFARLLRDLKAEERQ